MLPKKAIGSHILKKYRSSKSAWHFFLEKCLALSLFLLASASVAEADVAETVHNLSASGPGTLKAPSVGQICIFCHTPHNANPTRALWNQALPGVTYKLYTSSTLEASLNQPTGASRLCLSCHDGTLALGSMRVPPSGAPVAMAPLTGSGSLGTDLSDDHPISFVYNTSLAVAHGELADPSELPRDVKLDDTQQLQCTACHDPHKNAHRKFLRLDDSFGRLCTACHNMDNWSESAHATSSATWHGTGTNPWSDSPFSTVAERACGNCHESHAAARPERLMANSLEREVCLVCHDGSVASKNLEPEFLKPSRHPNDSADWIHEPREDPFSMSRHVTCADCHNPHQVVPTAGIAPEVSGRLQGVMGVSISGAVVSSASYEYEICLKCHGMKDQTGAGIIRKDNTRNVRLEINPSNPSYHPVAAAGKHPTIQGLEPGYTASSVISCTACHNNDEWTSTGTQPIGPHGSRIEPILEREYQQDDPSTESPQSYALCYKCHNRNILLSGGTFPHATHVAHTAPASCSACHDPHGSSSPPGHASCAVCHDAHGSRENTRLINFMLRDKNGKVVVSPNKKGVIEFTPMGPGHGECSLTCHNTEHDSRAY